MVKRESVNNNETAVATAAEVAPAILVTPPVAAVTASVEPAPTPVLKVPSPQALVNNDSSNGSNSSDENEGSKVIIRNNNLAISALEAQGSESH